MPIAPILSTLLLLGLGYLTAACLFIAIASVRNYLYRRH